MTIYCKHEYFIKDEIVIKMKYYFKFNKGVFNWIQLTIANTDGCNKKDKIFNTNKNLFSNKVF